VVWSKTLARRFGTSAPRTDVEVLCPGSGRSVGRVVQDVPPDVDRNESRDGDVCLFRRAKGEPNESSDDGEASTCSDLGWTATSSVTEGACTCFEGR
jgi:hypothetical protein